MKKLSKKLTKLFIKAQSVLQNNKGISQQTGVLIVVLVGLVVAVGIFFPQIKSFFTDTLFKKFTEKTTSLFNS